jgi:signal transduction histidine kinase
VRPLRDLSFRYKIPLRGAVLVLITAFLLSASLIYREYRDLKEDVIATSASLGRLLAKTLITPMIHDDVWRAYEIINSPFAANGPDNPKIADFIVVLDRRHQVYIATHPGDYRMLTDPGRSNPDFNRLQDALASFREFESKTVELDHSDRIYMVTPIVSDGVLLGTLVMGHSKSAFMPRFLDIAKSGGVVALLVIAFLIPASWYWAQRFAKPLVDLADTMGKVKTSIPDDSDIRIEESGDEIGRLGSAFKDMLQGLREKESLEKQMILSERLAAVGRLAAAIAHEINNPLGGMLNALNTFKRHGSEDPLAVRTFSLVERGLVQIKDTLSAMLVEVRQRSHELTRQDVEDTRTLVLPNAQNKNVAFAWQNEVPGSVSLPATPVRQILINLLLNAVQAVEDGGKMGCTVNVENGVLGITVTNSGDLIPQESMEVLFEPLSTTRDAGHGLGLWVTYQLVHQLGGEIIADSQPGETRFSVALPIPGITA